MNPRSILLALAIASLASTAEAKEYVCTVPQFCLPLWHSSVQISGPSNLIIAVECLGWQAAIGKAQVEKVWDIVPSGRGSVKFIEAPTSTQRLLICKEILQ